MSMTATMTLRYQRPDGTTDSITVERILSRPEDPPGVVIPVRVEAGLSRVAVQLAADVLRIYGPRQDR